VWEANIEKLDKIEFITLIKNSYSHNFQNYFTLWGVEYCPNRAGFITFLINGVEYCPPIGGILSPYRWNIVPLSVEYCPNKACIFLDSNNLQRPEKRKEEKRKARACVRASSYYNKKMKIFPRVKLPP
jgi:hypothetical protein